MVAQTWCNWEAKGDPGCYRGGKSLNNGLICYLCPWLHTVLVLVFEKHFLDYCDRKQQKQCLLINTTHEVVYMYSVLCVFVSQYSNKVNFISNVGLKGPIQNWGLRSPFASPWSRHWCQAVFCKHKMPAQMTERRAANGVSGTHHCPDHFAVFPLIEAGVERQIP